MMWTSSRLAGCVRKLLVLELAIAVPLFSQNQTAVVWHGLLRNSEGAPIAGAEVKLSGAAKAQANTIADGSFTLPALPVGQYKLTIIAKGRIVPYTEAITLAPTSSAVAITLSGRDE